MSTQYLGDPPDPNKNKLASPKARRRTVSARRQDHTIISEEEVLSSKNLISFDKAFPVNVTRKQSALTLEKLKSELAVDNNRKIFQTRRTIVRRKRTTLKKYDGESMICYKDNSVAAFDERDDEAESRVNLTKPGLALGHSKADKSRSLMTFEYATALVDIYLSISDEEDAIRRRLESDRDDADDDDDIDIKYKSQTIELSEDEDDKDAKFSKQRRENLLREVWEKQYQHNMQTFGQAVVARADRLSSSNNLKDLNKAIMLYSKKYNYYINRAKILHKLYFFDNAIENLEHVLNKSENELQNCHLNEEEPGDELKSLIYFVNKMILDYTRDWAEHNLEKHHYEVALKCYSEVLENPTCSEDTNLVIQLRISECLLAKNKRSECLELLNYLCSRWNRRCDLLLMRAKLHGKSLDSKKQYDDVRKALDIDSNNFPAQKYYKELEDRAQILYDEALKLTNSKQYWAAHQKINLGIEILPDKVEFYLLRGMLKRCIGEFLDAVEDLSLVLNWFEEDLEDDSEEVDREALTEKDDNHQGENIFITQPDAEGGDKERGVATATPKIAKPPKLNTKAVLLETRKIEAKYQVLLTLNDFACEISEYDLSKALCILSSIIQSNDIVNIPGHIYSNRARILTKLKRYKSALADYEISFKMDEQVHTEIASLNFKIGNEFYKNFNFEKAHEMYSNAINWNDKDIRYYLKRANTRYMLRLLNKSKKDFETAVNIYENIVSGGQILGHSGKFGNAVSIVTGSGPGPAAGPSPGAGVGSGSRPSSNKLQNLDFCQILNDINKLSLILLGTGYVGIKSKSILDENFVSKVKIAGS